MKKQKLSCSLAVLMLGLTLLTPAAGAAEVPGVPVESQQDWSSATRFYLSGGSIAKPTKGYVDNYYQFDNGDGTLSAIIRASDSNNNNTILILERYDAEGKLVSQKQLDMELPKLKAFYAGGGYFYLAFGQDNDEEDDSQEVWRIVKYDLSGNRLGSVSATGGETYTTEPFRSTVARMALSDDGETLVLHAARKRYDGHQSNITFYVNAKTMTWQNIMGEQFPTNHVSHSFGQFVRFDGEDVVTVDHGDAYPRSFYLQTPYSSSTLLELYGETGDNVTNAIGSGFEVSEDGYLFLGCSDPQIGDGGTWNVFLSYAPRADEFPETMTFGEITVTQNEDVLHGLGMYNYSIMGVGDSTFYVGGHETWNEGQKALAAYMDAVAPVKFTWLTNAGEDIKCARMVKLDDSSFVAMWEQGKDIHWQLLDSTGQKQGGEKVIANVTMPPNQPVVVGRSIRWIQEIEGTPTLLTLDVDLGGLVIPGVAYASTQNVLVDGKSVEFQCYALKDEQGNQTNYIKLRDVASVLNGTAAQFDIGWDGDVNIETGKGYIANGTEMQTPYSGNRAYEVATAATKVNGGAANLSAIVLKDDSGNGYTYYKLRDLGAALGFQVDWSAEQGIFIETM